MCDLEQFSRIKAQVYRSLLDQMSRRPEYAAATRVGGNDVPLLVSDLLCQMGEEGRRLAEAHLKKDPKGSSGALGVMALGCGRSTWGCGPDLQGRIGESGAIGMAARLECASRRTCSQAVVELHRTRLQKPSWILWWAFQRTRRRLHDQSLRFWWPAWAFVILLTLSTAPSLGPVR